MAYGQTDDIVELRQQLAELQAENERLRELNDCLEQLLASYRLSSRPSGKLLDRITELKDAQEEPIP